MDASKYIDKEVSSYKEETKDYMDEVKKLVFGCLVAKVSIDTFNRRLENLTNNYKKGVNKRQSNGYKTVDSIIYQNNLKNVLETTIKPDMAILDSLFQLLDKTSVKNADDRYIRVIKNYYKNTSKTLSKEYIKETEYLTKKLTQYDKVEKVVPYYRNDGIAYYDIATYDSMVYNTNLTKTAWNSTYKSAKELQNDLVYINPHASACEYCQEYQGKIYSLTGSDKRYALLQDVADEHGTMHPNCKHTISCYWGQIETDEYSNEENLEGYEATQKVNALNLKKKRLNTDLDVYKSIGNEEMVDKTKQKIKTLNSEIKEESNKIVY